MGHAMHEGRLSDVGGVPPGERQAGQPATAGFHHPKRISEKWGLTYLTDAQWKGKQQQLQAAAQEILCGCEG